jgi:hypothetical protein
MALPCYMREIPNRTIAGRSRTKRLDYAPQLLPLMPLYRASPLCLFASSPGTWRTTGKTSSVALAQLLAKDHARPDDQTRKLR